MTSRTLKSVFASYGYLLTDVAVFPARIGPLGYAFINFATLDEAVRAYLQLQNLVISALTGNKQLKMRFKPIAVRRPCPPHAAPVSLSVWSLPRWRSMHVREP